MEEQHRHAIDKKLCGLKCFGPKRLRHRHMGQKGKANLKHVSMFSLN